MKRKFLEKHNRFIAFLLSILGIGSACTFGGCAYGIGPAMYGTPSATFKVSGNVTSPENTKIKGIRVVMQYDSVKTDAEGKYKIQTDDFPDNQNFNITFTDIDGELNGAFQSLDTVISFLNPKFTNGDGAWNSGETSKEFNVKLKSKN